MKIERTNIFTFPKSSQILFSLRTNCNGSIEWLWKWNESEESESEKKAAKSEKIQASFDSGKLRSGFAVWMFLSDAR